MPPEFWTVIEESNCEVTSCRLNWTAVQYAFPDQYRSLVLQYGSPDGAHQNGPFCGAKERPFRVWSGAVEFKHGNLFYSMMVWDQIPPELLDGILKHQSEFFRTMDQIPANELMAAFPMIMPKSDAFPGCDIPGLGKLRMDKLGMTKEDWADFAQFVCQKNISSFQAVMSSCSL
jgi:hypothetical protein